MGFLRFGMESGAVEQLSRITKVVGRNSIIHGRDLNSLPPDYDAALLPVSPPRTVTCCSVTLCVAGLAQRCSDRSFEGSWFHSPQGQDIVSFSQASRPDLGPTQPAVQYASGALFPRVKRSRIEADHSPPLLSTSEFVEVDLHSHVYISSLPSLNVVHIEGCLKC